jgi:hypothetical protein
MPAASGVAVHGRVIGGVLRRKRIEQAEPLEAKRVKDFVIPEHVGPRALGFLHQFSGQPDGLRRFGVVFGPHGDARARLPFVEDRLGELFVLGRVDDDLSLRFRPAARQQRQKAQQAADCPPSAARIAETPAATLCFDHRYYSSNQSDRVSDFIVLLTSVLGATAVQG